MSASAAHGYTRTLQPGELFWILQDIYQLNRRKGPTDRLELPRLLGAKDCFPSTPQELITLELDRLKRSLAILGMSIEETGNTDKDTLLARWRLVHTTGAPLHLNRQTKEWTVVRC